MNYFKFLPLLIMVAFCGSGRAQNQQIKKADKLYKLNEYSEAISLYEEGLQKEESLSAKTNLAYCYLKTNRLNNAEQLYREIVNEERSKPITKYYYGETLMSNGKYEEAKNWFQKYAELNPNDERAHEMAAACDQVKQITPMFENVELKNFPQNSKADDSGPVFYKGGIVFTSDRKSGINPLKQKSGWTGRDFQQIYYSEADPGEGFIKPEVFSAKFNELNKHCGPLSFNADQNVVIFARTGKESGKNDTYNMQLYYSETNNGTKWKSPKVLSFCRTDHNYMHPALSPDGKTLYFVSDKPDGEGGTDIYKSKLTDKGWSKPINLGINVNTSFNEGFPFVGPDGKLYFSSKGHSGYGGFDIFMVEQDDRGLWTKPQNVGIPINSSYDDISFHLNNTSTQGLFSSSRGGDDDNIYIFEITPASMFNAESDEPKVVIEREALKSTNINEATASTEVDVKEGKVVNQLKSNPSNSDEKNAIRMSDETQNTDAKAEAISETKPMNENKENKIQPAANTNENPENVIPATKTEAENISLVETGHNSTENTTGEVKSKQQTPEPEIENEIGEVKILDERKTDRTPATQSNPNASLLAPVLFTERPNPAVYPFAQINQLLKKGENIKGKTFRMNEVRFEKGQYIITPEIALKLNALVDILQRYPDLEIEIAAHSNSLGDDMENLEVSRARAGAIAAHLINRGIAGERINAEGYGENRLLNRCSNGVYCSEKEHSANERIELAIF